mgnify:FL=1
MNTFQESLRNNLVHNIYAAIQGATEPKVRDYIFNNLEYFLAGLVSIPVANAITFVAIDSSPESDVFNSFTVNAVMGLI